MIDINELAPAPWTWDLARCLAGDCGEGTGMKSRVVFKSITDEWRTPKSVYDALNAEFEFKFDPCPMDEQGFWDSLALPWKFPAFVNPPYSDIANWVKKSFEESANGIVVMLIPSRTDTLWWHKYVMNAKEIRFIKGRLKFGNAKNSAPFPSCIVVFASEAP